jgi:hypothetical protein
MICKHEWDPTFIVSALIFAHDNSLLHDLMLLPEGARCIAKRGDGRARRSNFPKGALTFRRARSAGA